MEMWKLELLILVDVLKTKELTVVAMVTQLPQQSGMWLMPVILRKLHTKYELNSTQDKRVIYITLWLPW